MKPFLGKPAVFAFICTLIAISGCTKYPNRDDGRFRCDCGDLEWNGQVLELRMAEMVTSDSVNFNYHVIADFRSQDEIDSRAAARDLVMNIRLSFQEEGDSLIISSDEEANFIMQELRATAPSADWDFERAVYNVNISETEHILDLYELTANRNGQTAIASGQFIFDLDD